jgi:hypothetical protein
LSNIHKLSKDIGVYRFFYDPRTPDYKIPLAPLGIPGYIPIIPRMLPLLVTIFVEGIRLLFSVGPMSNDIARKVLSIVLALIDFLKGEWKHALLSFAGYYGQYPLVIGIILKVFIDILTTSI